MLLIYLRFFHDNFYIEQRSKVSIILFCLSLRTIECIRFDHEVTKISTFWLASCQREICIKHYVALPTTCAAKYFRVVALNYEIIKNTIEQTFHKYQREKGQNDKEWKRKITNHEKKMPRSSSSFVLCLLD